MLIYIHMVKERHLSSSFYKVLDACKILSLAYVLLILLTQMTSEETKRDLETLLSMEIKLRLLDTEGINIPETPPPIPKEPPNYDFVFKNL